MTRLQELSIERTMETHEPVLVADGLTKRYGERLVVDGVGFTIGLGETYGLLGPNGARRQHGAARDLPPLMARIAHLIPHAWAIEALTASISDGTGPAGVATQLLVLAAYAVGLLALATVLLRRAITSHAT